jgi:hypothetical protein
MANLELTLEVENFRLADAVVEQPFTCLRTSCRETYDSNASQLPDATEVVVVNEVRVLHQDLIILIDDYNISLTSLLVELFHSQDLDVVVYCVKHL